MIAPLLAWRPAGGLSYQRKEYTYGRKDFIGCQHRRLSYSHYLLSSDKVPDYHGQVLRQAGCPDTGNPQGTLVKEKSPCGHTYKIGSGCTDFLCLKLPKSGKITHSPLWPQKRGKNWDGVVSWCVVLSPLQSRCSLLGKNRTKKNGPRFLGGQYFQVVPKAGLEPARICIRQILSLCRTFFLLCHFISYCVKMQ